MLAAAVRTLRDAIVITDSEVRVQLVNAAAENLLDVSEPDVVGRDAVEAFVDPRHHHRARVWIERLLAGQRLDPELHTMLSRRDGTSFGAEISICPLRDDDGAI